MPSLEFSIAGRGQGAAVAHRMLPNVSPMFLISSLFWFANSRLKVELRGVEQKHTGLVLFALKLVSDTDCCYRGKKVLT